MATSMIVPLEEYLHKSYEPDCEYLDGELVERNLGTNSHSRLQESIYSFFRHRRKAWGVTPMLEVRTRNWAAPLSDPGCVL